MLFERKKKDLCVITSKTFRRGYLLWFCDNEDTSMAICFSFGAAELSSSSTHSSGNLFNVF